jgi:hypothetical protein
MRFGPFPEMFVRPNCFLPQMVVASSMDLDDFPIPTSQRSARTAVIAYTAAFTSGMPFQVRWVEWVGVDVGSREYLWLG